MGRNRVLLGLLASNGDCLYGTTVARQIKKDHPGCHLVWGISSRCRHLLVNNPDVDEVWEFPFFEWAHYVANWHSFELAARHMVATGQFDRAWFLQISPGVETLRNYDGTVRPSLFRNYGAPITVPIQSILLPTALEEECAERFIKRTDFLSYDHRIVFECYSKSGQSFMSPELALQAARRLVERLPGACVVLSSHMPINSGHPAILDGSALTMRETAVLLRSCTLFAGCGSGLTVIATCIEQADPNLPVVQMLRADTALYASFARDFDYWKLGSERFIESCEADPERIASMIEDTCRNGVVQARERWHRPVPLTFDFYLNMAPRPLLSEGYPEAAAHSLLLAGRRFGWNETLEQFAGTELWAPLETEASKGCDQAALRLAELSALRF